MASKTLTSKEKRELTLFAAAVLSANILGMLHIRGPLNMSFSLTALPILLTSLSMGWERGFLVGIFGGVMQAVNYGSPLYIFYTTIMGAVSGFFAKNHGLTRRWGSLLFAAGVFFMFIWVITVDIKYMASEILGILMSILIFAAIEYTMIKKHLAHNPLLNLTLAGCAGITACIPYNITVLSLAQNYALAPSLIILAKDLIQDYTAAIFAAVLMQYEPLKRILGHK